MSAVDDLRDLRDALDSIARGALPRWGMPTTRTGQEAQAVAREVYDRWVNALRFESAAKAAADFARLSEDQHRTHAEILTARCEAAEAERDEARAELEGAKQMARGWEEVYRTEHGLRRKAAEERDELRYKLAGEAAHIKSLEGLLVDAARERDEARRDLGEILAVIHRDGGHYTGERGVSQSVADAHATWAAVVRERDEARDELAKTSADFHDVWESRDKVIEERERARQACNAYWHDLTRIALLCAQTDDEYPLKAVERTVREFAQSRRDFVRVADALGLVGTDDTGRIGAIASVEDIVAQARLAARALSREQPVAEEEQ